MSKQSTGHPVLDHMEAELDRLWGFALRMTRDRDDAADLVQRTCTRAIERRDQYNSGRPLHSWLFGIAQNLWLNELRTRDKDRRGWDALSSEHQTSAAAQLSAAHHGTDTAPENSALLADVERAVNSLPDPQRDVLLLVAVEGFAYREAAEVLGIPIGTVMSRLARARLAIGKQFVESTPTLSSPRSKITSILRDRRNKRRESQQ